MFDYDKKNWREEEKKQGLKELKQLKEIVGFLLDQQQKYHTTPKMFSSIKFYFINYQSLF